jgi:hypothetical protein
VFCIMASFSCPIAPDLPATFAIDVVSEGPSVELESLDWMVGVAFGFRRLRRMKTMRAKAPSAKTVMQTAIPIIAPVERPPDFADPLFCAAGAVWPPLVWPPLVWLPLAWPPLVWLWPPLALPPLAWPWPAELVA